MLLVEHAAHERVILCLRHRDNVSKSIELMMSLAMYFYVCWGARSLPSQMPNTLLTTALIIWLDYHSIEEIPTLEGCLEVTVTPLCVLLTMECSTRFILRKVQVATKYHPIARSGLECNTWVWYCVSTYSP